MFTLAITHPQTSPVTTHPSREVALGRLVQFLEATGHRSHVITATWTHAEYKIVSGSGCIVGHAVLDEICVCTHAACEHEETGCNAISFETGPFAECRCDGHQPLSSEAGLFAAEVPT